MWRQHFYYVFYYIIYLFSMLYLCCVYFIFRFLTLMKQDKSSDETHFPDESMSLLQQMNKKTNKHMINCRYSFNL